MNQAGTLWSSSLASHTCTAGSWSSIKQPRKIYERFTNKCHFKEAINSFTFELAVTIMTTNTMFNLFGNKEKEIEKAKNQLIYDLEHNGIVSLIRKMDCREPYSPLIKERQLKEGSYSSEDNISMIAYRVSVTLNNPNDKQELLHLLDDPEYREYRIYIFCCLASLCSNTSDYDLFDFLLKQIEIEDDENIIVSVLSRLDEIIKPRDKDIRVIKFFLVEGTNNTQQAAIKALSNSEDEEVEDLLLSEFKIGDRHVKGMICTPLLSVGTKKAIPILQTAYKQTREPFLRHQIECVLDEINNK